MLELSPLVLLVSLLTFGSVMQLSTMYDWRPWTSAVTVVLVPYVFVKALNYVFTNYDVQALWPFHVEELVTLILQLGVGLFVFYKYSQTDNSVLATFQAGLGAVVIYLAIPAVF